MITDLKRLDEKLKNDLKEAKFELRKPKNLLCNFHFVVSDLTGLYTVSIIDSKETNEKHYTLTDCSPSEVDRWTAKGVSDIIEAYKDDVELKSMKYEDYFKFKVKTLTAQIDLNNEMIEEFSK